jgi:hypothetical protein
VEEPGGAIRVSDSDYVIDASLPCSVISRLCKSREQPLVTVFRVDGGVHGESSPCRFAFASCDDRYDCVVADEHRPMRGVDSDDLPCRILAI